MVERGIREFFSVSQTVKANLRSELKSLLRTFSADESKAVETADSLISKYSEKHRAYHNLSHVHALLQTAEKFKNEFADYESARLAVWFHDAIYEPKSVKNEIESARLAVKSLSELSFPQAQIEKVKKMILATQKHDATALDKDGKRFLDLDLGILGAKEEVYKKYTEAIRKEYSFAPEKEYRQKRCKVLRAFLQREFIYYTEEMQALFETRARRNIANEIKELS